MDTFVYVLEVTEWDDTSIVGVFATIEAAQEARPGREWNYQKWTDSDGTEYEEWHSEAAWTPYLSSTNIQRFPVRALSADACRRSCDEIRRRRRGTARSTR